MVVGKIVSFIGSLVKSAKSLPQFEISLSGTGKSDERVYERVCQFSQVTLIDGRRVRGDLGVFRGGVRKGVFVGLCWALVYQSL